MISIETGNRRLLQLAKILDRVPAVKQVGKDKMRGYDQEAVTHPCGSPACAWGHWLYGNKERFKRIALEDGARKNDIKFVLDRWHSSSVVHDGRYVSFYDAGEREFALSPGETTMLFEAHGCGRATTGKQAANYIRIFVAGRRQEARRAKKLQLALEDLS